MNIQTQLINKIGEVTEKAKILGFPVTFNIDFSLRGKCAGQAVASRINSQAPWQHVVRINLECAKLSNENFRHMIDETIPHEIAHTICIEYGLGSGHCETWRKICRALGGVGERCHSLTMKPARNVKKYKYNTPTGEIILSSIRHNKIQSGKVAYRAKVGGVEQRISKENAWEVA